MRPSGATNLDRRAPGEVLESHIELLRLCSREIQATKRVYYASQMQVEWLECRINEAREHSPDGRVFDESGMEIDPDEEVIARIRHGVGLGISTIYLLHEQ